MRHRSYPRPDSAVPNQTTLAVGLDGQARPAEVGCHNAPTAEARIEEPGCSASDRRNSDPHSPKLRSLPALGRKIRTTAGSVEVSSSSL